MFTEFLKKDNFYQYYMQQYITKMATSNIEMEDRENKVQTNKAILMYQNINAFLKLLKNDKKITPYDLIDIAHEINKLEGISRGFRKTQVDVKCADFFPINPLLVPQAIYSLFDNYEKTWKDLDVYEKEARFHIELVRIQPFEDGNKRTARIVTNYNLCRQNRAPVIIEGKETDSYFKFINDYDINGFQKYLKEKSNQEFERMLQMYQKICGNDLTYCEKDKLDKMTNNILKDIQKTLK